MKTTYNIAIVGVENILTKELLLLLEQTKFPLAALRLLSLKPISKRVLSFRNADYAIDVVSPASFRGYNFAFFLEKDETIFDLIEGAKKVKCMVIDNTLHFAFEDNIPLIVPEVNSEKIVNNTGIIANPDSSAIFLALSLKPIYNRVGISKVNVNVFLSASADGEEAVRQLKTQTKDFLNEDISAKNIYQNFSAFNIIPFMGEIEENGYTNYENNLALSLKKILQDNSIIFSVTTVKVPFLQGSALSVTVETKKKITAEEAKSAFSISPAIYLTNKEEERKFLTPLTLQNKELVFVGRVREVIDENILSFWVLGDNLIKGGALNLIQIINLYIEKFKKDKETSVSQSYLF